MSSTIAENILDHQRSYLHDLTVILSEAAIRKFSMSKELLEKDKQNVLRLAEKTECELTNNVKDLEESIKIKNDAITRMSKEIVQLEAALDAEQKAHLETKELLTACQTELKNTGQDLERYLEVSQQDRYTIQAAYLEMREKAIEESLKCSKYVNQYSKLRSDKENCELKLRDKEAKVQKLNKSIKSTKKAFEKDLINKEAERQQLQYLSLLKDQLNTPGKPKK